jgi:hypothetical protein
MESIREAKVDLLEASVARPYVDDLTVLLSRGSIVEQNPASAPSSSTSRRSSQTRAPYRCAVGLMINTDEVSEQRCRGKLIPYVIAS